MKTVYSASHCQSMILQKPLLIVCMFHQTFNVSNDGAPTMQGKYKVYIWAVIGWKIKWTFSTFI
jgi:hypothetical protein